jgi:hypothetical protein
VRREFGKLVRDTEVVAKPFTAEELVSAVRRALAV